MSDRPLSEVVAAAIENGEILRVRYDAGSQAGTIRDIRPLALDGARVRARDGGGLPKSYFLSKLTIESVDAVVTYILRKGAKRRIVDPVALTKDWAFAVPMPSFADAFDIAATFRIHNDLKTGVKTRLSVWTQGSPPEYQFERGDSFCHPAAVTSEGEWGSHDSAFNLQVVESSAANVVIRFRGFRRGVRVLRKDDISLSYEDFLNILKFGPSHPLWLLIDDSQHASATNSPAKNKNRRRKIVDVSTQPVIPIVADIQPPQPIIAVDGF